MFCLSSTRKKIPFEYHCYNSISPTANYEDQLPVIYEVFIARMAKLTLFLSSMKFIKPVEHKDYALPSIYEVFIARRALTIVEGIVK